MEKPVGIKEIAKLSNTSIGTVDRVLNNRTGVSIKTKERVLEVIKKTGYVKNNVASRLKLSAGKKIKIAVILPKGNSKVSYWSLPKNGVKKALNELNNLGVEVDFISFRSDDIKEYKNLLSPVFNDEYNGVITVSLFDEISNQLVAYCTENKKELVFIDNKNNNVTNANFICQNSIKSGRVAGRLLYNCVGDSGDFIALTFLQKSEYQGNQKVRELAFKEFLEQKNPKINIHTIVHTIDQNLENNTVLNNLLNSKTTKGVFITNSRSYLFSNYIKSKGLKNIKIVGFDLNEKNVEELKNENIQYLINQKPELQGYQALMKIFQKITQDDSISLNIDIPIEIIVKENFEDSSDVL
ncbi:hypothetical protein AXE80_07925 [Wenyingzhuangia fucanilytica]|uniref:HTH lacI-type domain-containing protein n=1 Tax=Wenyingzhuangia fucanilytica TaxID=1790137 RepID=A0A1B1Y648_9FLAO|nr:substrate-binding domain-containing protein [Wenyingzhuangia fucanilytica]ANW96208.1 hypothetical protein AXE80_07925 [Wenyingzhuangia fucanilytica]